MISKSDQNIYSKKEVTTLKHYKSLNHSYFCCLHCLEQRSTLKSKPFGKTFHYYNYEQDTLQKVKLYANTMYLQV